uniref:HNH endonuclease n=1 Tax=viral metagenome TaxID=1070528 RepID=A0A6C0HSD8_9ZZZZ
MSHESKLEQLIGITDNFTKIVSTTEIKEKCPELYWGGNGLGDRLGKVNYSSISKIGEEIHVDTYSENDDKIPDEILNQFKDSIKGSKKGRSILGLFVYSIRKNTQQRSIRKDIRKNIRSLSCVVCGTHKTICDHKNDLYNDTRVLSLETQLFSDFQPLCNHCNLQKRQICKTEQQTGKVFSAKNIERYKCYHFDFPWEKKVFDKNDINCKNGTYWFDPVEFDKNIYYYSVGVIPIITEIKYKIKTNKLKLIA